MLIHLKDQHEYKMIKLAGGFISQYVDDQLDIDYSPAELVSKWVSRIPGAKI